MFKAVIFDRDGTLNRTTTILREGQKAGDPTDGYVLKPEELVLFPQVRHALTVLQEKGVLCFVFTQQNCLNKGLVSQTDLDRIHNCMNEQIGPFAKITHFAVASAPDPRAKPSPAMIEEIMSVYQLDQSEVLVVGDSMRDYHAALAASVAFCWVRDDLGRVPEQDMKNTRCPIFNNVLDVVEFYFSTKSRSVENVSFKP